ncbi:MAG TPA: phospholipase D-like domain-containing protein [Acidobacteriaceae bacterium]|nr:phospholipase D-like domain-containing protein [Acidobacteriaceae bacterium]
MKLLIQPEGGIEPLLDGLRKAKKSIQILIFRIDRSEIEKALVEAAGRGVAVQALIAYTNRGGDKNLRRFEMRLLERGITVTRTSDDLVRYHGKMFIVDGKELYLLAFNFTHLDISMSRSFAVVVTKPAIVKEACKLFEADVKRVPYEAGHKEFVVSPANAREELTKFIMGAKKQLLMYEMKISDHEFIKMLTDKVSAGVDVRIIGTTPAKGSPLAIRKLPMRLHARAIMRDGESAFLGSMSLRKLELEARREIGVIVHDAKVVKQMAEIFDKDWKNAEPVATAPQDAMQTAFDISAKKVARSVAKKINVGPVVEQLLDKVADNKTNIDFQPDEMAQTLREAFREEVHDAVVSTLQDMSNAATEAANSKEASDAKA